jgi:hypothetical protein
MFLQEKAVETTRGKGATREILCPSIRIYGSGSDHDFHGSSDSVACAYSSGSGFFVFFSSFCLVASNAFISCKEFVIYMALLFNGNLLSCP